MAELTAADLESYTKDRLPDDDDTQALLDAALVSARRYCGWHVCPVVTVTVTLDGPGHRLLSLPSLHVLSVASVVENGVALDVSSLDVSQDKGTIEKYPRGCWTSRAGAITVTMTHGFTEAEAADWRRAVLRLANLMDLEAAGESPEFRNDPALTVKTVDDVTYQWASGIISADTRLSALFAPYRILPSS